MTAHDVIAWQHDLVALMAQLDRLKAASAPDSRSSLAATPPEVGTRRADLSIVKVRTRRAHLGGETDV